MSRTHPCRPVSPRVGIILGIALAGVWAPALTWGGPVPSYNAGVEAYQDGRYCDAERGFSGALGDERLGALAAWNLGRASAARGDWSAAEFWWREARKQAETDQLREMARRQLAAFDALRSPGSGYASFGVGYDSNAPLEESGAAFEDRSAAFAEVLASGTRQLTGRRFDGWQARATVQAREYDDLDDFGYADAGATLHHVRPVALPVLGPWRRDLSVGAGATRVGSESTDTRLQLGAEIERPVPGRGWLDLRYRFTWHQGGGERDWLDGVQHQGRIRFRDRAAPVPWGVLYAIEVHDRDDLRGDDFFTSYSPTRHRIQTFATARPADRWSVTGRAELQYVVYRDPNEIDDESRRRSDQRAILALEVEREVGDAWGIGSRVRLEHLDSQRTDFDSRSLDRYDANRAEWTVFLDRVF